MNNPGLQVSVEVLIRKLMDDPDYAWSWFCNLKMAAVDAGATWVQAAQTAANFLSNFTTGLVKMEDHPFWEKDASSARALDAHKAQEPRQYPEVEEGRDVIHITVEARRHGGSVQLSEAIAHLLTGVMPHTPVVVRPLGHPAAREMLTANPRDLAAVEVNAGTLDLDIWNEEETYPFSIVVEARPTDDLRLT